MVQGKRGENAGARKERETPAQRPSAESGSVLLSVIVSPAQQPVKSTVATKMVVALLSLHTRHHPGGNFTWAEKLPGSSGWAGTKREAPLMCLRAFTGVRLENMPDPDAPQGVDTTELNTLDTEKPVLYRQWDLPTGKRLPAPPPSPSGKQRPLAAAQQEQRSCRGQAPPHHQHTHHHPPVGVRWAHQEHTRHPKLRGSTKGGDSPHGLGSQGAKHLRVTSPDSRFGKGLGGLVSALERELPGAPACRVGLDCVGSGLGLPGAAVGR